MALMVLGAVFRYFFVSDVVYHCLIHGLSGIMQRICFGAVFEWFSYCFYGSSILACSVKSPT